MLPSSFIVPPSSGIVPWPRFSLRLGWWEPSCVSFWLSYHSYLPEQPQSRPTARAMDCYCLVALCFRKFMLRTTLRQRKDLVMQQMVVWCPHGVGLARSRIYFADSASARFANAFIEKDNTNIKNNPTAASRCSPPMVWSCILVCIW